MDNRMNASAIEGFILPVTFENLKELSQITSNIYP